MITIFLPYRYVLYCFYTRTNIADGCIHNNIRLLDYMRPITNLTNIDTHVLSPRTRYDL
jgi:hypothetical protein